MTPILHTPAPEPQPFIEFVVSEAETTATVNGVTGPVCHAMTKWFREASGNTVTLDRPTADRYADSPALSVARPQSQANG